MSGFIAQHLPDYSVPPVYLEGIRYSGHSGEVDGSYVDPYYYLNVYDEDNSWADYGSLSWDSDSGRLQLKPFFPSSGMQKYQYNLGNYTSGYPRDDSSLNVMLKNVTFNDLNYSEDYFSLSQFAPTGQFGLDNGYGDYSNRLEFVHFAPSQISNPDRDKSVESAISRIYGFGWGDTNHSKPRFSPQLKAGVYKFFNGVDSTGKFAWLSGNSTNEEMYSHSYQLAFLVDNQCKEIDMLFDIVNEHPLIQWDFDFLVCLNKSDLRTFSINTRDEDIFQESIVTGEGGIVLASGYYDDCSSTKYRVKIPNLPAKEGPTLVQIALKSMDFNARPENYIPLSLHEKILDSGDITDSATGKWLWSYKEHFWKELYSQPIAHHLTPWYDLAKNANWDAANCRFKPISHSNANSIYVPFQPPINSEKNMAGIDHGLGGSLPRFGNVADRKTWQTFDYTSVSGVVSGTPTPLCRQRAYNYVGDFINYGGFGRTVFPDRSDGSAEWNGSVEFAPVSITLEGITGHRNKPNRYFSAPILEVASSGRILLKDEFGIFQSGTQVNHGARYDCGEYGDLGAEYPNYTYVWSRSGDWIQIKDTKECNPDSCNWGLLSGNVQSGVLRALMSSETGVRFDFTSGSNYAVTNQRLNSGTILSFGDFYISGSSSQTKGFSLNKGEDYVIVEVSEPSSGVFRNTIKAPIEDSSSALKSAKVFNKNVFATGYFGDPSSEVIEVSQNPFYCDVLHISTDDATGVLPQTSDGISGKFEFMHGYTDTFTIGYC